MAVIHRHRDILNKIKGKGNLGQLGKINKQIILEKLNCVSKIEHFPALYMKTYFLQNCIRTGRSKLQTKGTKDFSCNKKNTNQKEKCLYLIVLPMKPSINQM